MGILPSGVAVMVAVCSCGGSRAPSGAPASSGPPPMCAGQGAPPPTSTARTGPTSLQLAPGFLDRMPKCSAVEAAPPAALVDAAGGTINDKGDCAWPSGVACHYHVSVEFVDSQETARPPATAELHCIFPVAGDAKSPRVYGTRFRCAAGTHLPGARSAEVGAACGASLLVQLAERADTCDARCCDDGTLTTALSVRKQAATLDVRPDFRMCAATAVIDCGALGPLMGHSANAPVFGAPVETP